MDTHTIGGLSAKASMRCNPAVSVEIRVASCVTPTLSMATYSAMTDMKLSIRIINAYVLHQDAH